MHASLHSSKGSTFIYAWWFFLSNDIVPATTFWHIFETLAVDKKIFNF
jgi:hypothetical protein